jgi:hypothetical protein
MCPAGMFGSVVVCRTRTDFVLPPRGVGSALTHMLPDHADQSLYVAHCPGHLPLVKLVCKNDKNSLTHQNTVLQYICVAKWHFGGVRCISMKNLLIYGTTKSFTPGLLEQARLATLRAYRLVAKEWQIIVSDRHGLDAEVARICGLWSIPLHVCGLNARPRNGVSMRYYERVMACPIGTTAENLLNRYMMNMADNVVVIGETVDCCAMRLWARLNLKLVTPTLSTWRLYDETSAGVRITPTADTATNPKVIIPLDQRRTTQTALIVQ